MSEPDTKLQSCDDPSAPIPWLATVCAILIFVGWMVGFPMWAMVEGGKQRKLNELQEKKEADIIKFMESSNDTFRRLNERSCIVRINGKLIMVKSYGTRGSHLEYTEIEKQP